MLLVLVTPLIVRTDTLFPYVVAKALFARSVIEITFGLWLVLILYHPRYRPPKSWVIIALAVWLLVSLAASLTGVSLVRSLWSNFERMQGVVDRAHWLVFVLMAGTTFRTFAGWRLLLTVNLGLAGIVSGLGLGQHYGLFAFDWLDDSQRIASTLGNATYLGAYTMVNAIIGFGLLLQSLGRPQIARAPQDRRAPRTARRRQRPEPALVRFDYLPLLRAFWLLAALVCLWTLWLTATRGSIVGLGAGAIAFALGCIVYGRPGAVRTASYVVLAAVIAAGALFMLVRSSPALEPLIDSNAMLRRLALIGSEDDTSVSKRFLSISAGLRAYQDRPLLGWGPENYLIAWGRHTDAGPLNAGYFDQAHNKVVEEMATTGTLGLLSYSMIWAAMAFVLLRSVRRRQPHEQFLVIAAGSALAAFFVQNLFLFDSPATVMQLSVLIAFVVSEEAWLGERESASPASGQGAVERSSQPKGLPRLSRTPAGGAVLVLAIAALTAGALVQFNVRPYGAAQSASLSIRADSHADAAVHLQQSVHRFPALANLPRLFLVDKTIARLDSLSSEELGQAVSLIGTEGQRALRIEPENWRMHAALALFYQGIAPWNPGYLGHAGAHVRDVVRLAPGTYDAERLTDNQEKIEQQLMP